MIEELKTMGHLAEEIKHLCTDSAEIRAHRWNGVIEIQIESPNGHDENETQVNEFIKILVENDGFILARTDYCAFTSIKSYFLRRRKLR